MKKRKKFPKSRPNKGLKNPKAANFNFKKELTLAEQLLRTGDLRQAEQILRHILSVDPENSFVLYYLGIISYQKGDIEAGISTLRRAISLKPDFADYHNLLGILYSYIGDSQAAIACYEKATALAPDYYETYNNLGNIYYKLGQQEQALANYINAISIKPNFKLAQNNLGRVIKESANLEDVVLNYEKNLTVAPTNFVKFWNLAKALQDYGNFPLALRQFRNVLSIRPDHGESHRSISKLKKYSVHDCHIAEMEKIYHHEYTNENDKMHLGFALGKAYEDCNNYEKSFHYIASANHQKRSTYHYSIQESKRLFDNIKKSFDIVLKSSRIKQGVQDNTPIFVLGMPRSGTSLVEQILSSHPLVYGAGEIDDFKNSLLFLTDSKSVEKALEVFSLSPEGIIPILGNHYIQKLKQHAAHSPYITDKQLYNFQFIGFIYLSLPHAKIIHCTRDAMDNCLSIFKNYFSGTHPYAYDLTELGQYYLLYQDLMGYWLSIFPENIFNVSYENLVANQEVETRRILEHCGLPWDDACLFFYKNKSRRVRTASTAQVRKPIYNDSVHLWKKYGNNLKLLQEILETGKL